MLGNRAKLGCWSLTRWIAQRLLDASVVEVALTGSPFDLARIQAEAALTRAAARPARSNAQSPEIVSQLHGSGRERDSIALRAQTHRRSERQRRTPNPSASQRSLHPVVRWLALALLQRANAGSGRGWSLAEGTPVAGRERQRSQRDGLGFVPPFALVPKREPANTWLASTRPEPARTGQADTKIHLSIRKRSRVSTFDCVTGDLLNKLEGAPPGARARHR